MARQTQTEIIDRLNLTILTGFLGAGKTTLLNAFLSTEEAKGTAILVNEFGAVDVDGPVLDASVGSRNRVMSLPNGCICCEVQDDLADALITLAERKDTRRAILETTGLADPGAILRGVAHDPRLKNAIAVSAVISLAAAPDIINQIEKFAEARAQLALADRIVVSKPDLLDARAIRSVEHEIRQINPLADVLTRKPQSSALQVFASVERQDFTLPHHHHHSHGISTFCVRLSGPLDADIFRDTLSFWIMRHAEKLLRVKGLVKFCNDPVPKLLNGVHDVFNSEPASHVDPPKDGGSIVFIGVDLPESDLRADLQRCVTSL